jgi:hypothetical protein
MKDTVQKFHRNIDILKIILAIVYVYAGLAKLNSILAIDASKIWLLIIPIFH